MKLNNMTVKKWIALILKVVLALVVAIFAGSESLNFFNFIFPPEQWYLSYTGFGITMGSMFVYLYLLLNDAKTSLQRTVAFIMMLVGLAGELAAAGFGMQIEGWKKLGYQMTSENYDFMILAVRIAMVAHGLALMTYWAGDQIIELLKDDDKDGTPNYRDSDYKRPSAPQHQQARDGGESQPKPRPNQPSPSGGQTAFDMPQFLAASGITTEHAFGTFLDETETFGKAWQVLRDRQSAEGYMLPIGISHKNFNELAGKVRANGNFQTAGQR